MKIISLFFLILSTTQLFSQGSIDGFYRGQGNTNAVLGFGIEDTKHYFIGNERSDLSRSLYYASLFVSHGITNNLDVQVSLPYLVSDDNSDFQDISFFLKYQIFKEQTKNGNLQISLAGGYSTPLSNYSIGRLNDIGQQATVIDLRAMAHYQWVNNWFLTVQSGYSFKLEEVPNSIPAVLKFGKAAHKWYYDFYYEYQHSFGGIDYRGTPRPQNFKEFGVDFHKVGSTVFTAISGNFGTYVSLSYVLSGRNTFQGPTYGVGLVYDFKK